MAIFEQGVGNINESNDLILGSNLFLYWVEKNDEPLLAVLV